MPQLPDGYDLEAIRVWASGEDLIEDHPGSKERVPYPPSEDNGELNSKSHYETKLKKVQAQLKALELAQKEGKLIPVEEVEAGRVARVTAVKRSLLAVPRALAPQLMGLEAREIEAILMEKMREICTRFSLGRPN
jgi:hypothetical protein